MTLQAYQGALADLRHWHEGDRFQRHFDDIEAHVNALSPLAEVKSLPAPISILLTRDSEGRLLNPTTGEPFTIVIHTIDGNREVTHITFAGERDAPIKLPDPVYVDSEKSAGSETIANVMISDLREAELRDALQRAVEAEDGAKVHELLSFANPDVVLKVLLPTQELVTALNHGTQAQIVEAVRAALAPPTIDGIPVVPSDDPLLTTVHPDVSPVTLGAFDDLGKDELPDESDTEDGDDEADEPADDVAPTDIATSDEAVPAVKPPRKPAKKKRG